jgi:hypothetical protein
LHHRQPVVHLFFAQPAVVHHQRFELLQNRHAKGGQPDDEVGGENRPQRDVRAGLCFDQFSSHILLPYMVTTYPASRVGSYSDELRGALHGGRLSMPFAKVTAQPTCHLQIQYEEQNLKDGHGRRRDRH